MHARISHVTLILQWNDWWRCEVWSGEISKKNLKITTISTRRYLLLWHLPTLLHFGRFLETVLFANNVATVYRTFASHVFDFHSGLLCYVHRNNKQMYTRCINFQTDLTTDGTIHNIELFSKCDRKSWFAFGAHSWHTHTHINSPRRRPYVIAKWAFTLRIVKSLKISNSGAQK